MAIKRTTDEVTTQVVKVTERILFTGLSSATIDGNKLSIRQNTEGNDAIFECVLSNTNLQALADYVRGSVTTKTIKKSRKITDQINELLDTPKQQVTIKKVGKRPRRANLTQEEFLGVYTEVYKSGGSAADAIAKLGCSSPCFYRWLNAMRDANYFLPKLTDARVVKQQAQLKQVETILKNFR